MEVYVVNKLTSSNEILGIYFSQTTALEQQYQHEFDDFKRWNNLASYEQLSEVMGEFNEGDKFNLKEQIKKFQKHFNIEYKIEKHNVL